jgi:hypothetical protein
MIGSKEDRRGPHRSLIYDLHFVVGGYVFRIIKERIICKMWGWHCPFNFSRGAVSYRRIVSAPSADAVSETQLFAF